MNGARTLPGSETMRELVGAIGDDAALALARRFGGTTIYVPRTIGVHHPLHSVLGDVAAVKLASWYGGQRLNVPKQIERRERVRELRRSGALTIAAIAIETGFSERHVYRLLNKPDDRQLDMFE